MEIDPVPPWISGCVFMGLIESIGATMAHRRLQMPVGSRVRSRVGIAEEAMRRLFHPFVTTKPQGMGVGLSISKTSLRAMAVACFPAISLVVLYFPTGPWARQTG
jgi:hypothetical protein